MDIDKTMLELVRQDHEILRLQATNTINTVEAVGTTTITAPTSINIKAVGTVGERRACALMLRALRLYRRLSSTI